MTSPEPHEGKDNESDNESIKDSIKKDRVEQKISLDFTVDASPCHRPLGLRRHRIFLPQIRCRRW
jgi:hypothetical protein